MDVTAPEPLPPFPASVMDGYALVASDGEGVLEVFTTRKEVYQKPFHSLSPMSLPGTQDRASSTEVVLKSMEIFAVTEPCL